MVGCGFGGCVVFNSQQGFLTDELLEVKQRLDAVDLMLKKFERKGRRKAV